MTTRNLSNRVDDLEKATSNVSFFIRMHPGETQQEAQARWLGEHPDRRADLERAGAQVRFVRRVIVSVSDERQVGDERESHDQ